MLAVEAELITAVETDVGIDFVENSVVKDGVELGKFNDFVGRKQVHSLDFRSSEEHFCSNNNRRSFM